MTHTLQLFNLNEEYTHALTERCRFFVRHPVQSKDEKTAFSLILKDLKPVESCWGDFYNFIVAII